jgi:hypothetical protein
MLLPPQRMLLLPTLPPLKPLPLMEPRNNENRI